MGLHCLMMPRESAWEVLNELGQLDKVHLVDCEEEVAQFNRPFYQQVKRCDEQLLKIQWIENEMIKFYTFYNQVVNSKQTLAIDYCGDMNAFHEYLNQDIKNKKVTEQAFFNVIEQEINSKYKFLEQLLNNFSSVIAQRNHLVQKRLVLKEAMVALNIASLPSSGQAPVSDPVSLNFIGGVIEAVDEIRFNKNVFRTSRGNIWTHFKPVDKGMQSGGYKLLNLKASKQGQGSSSHSNIADPYNTIQKTVFLLAFASGAGSVLDRKVRRICEAFDAETFTISTSQIRAELQETENLIIQQNKIVSISENSINEYFDFYQRKIGLQNGGDLNEICSYIEYVRLFLHKEKTVQLNLNYLVSNGQSFCKGLLWLPEEDEPIVSQTLQDLGRKKSNQLQTAQLHKIENYTIDPPTKFKQNEFTMPFQEIVNTYGIPRYQEINPGYFCIITFPFLFGMMFGDAGHGLMLFVLGLYLLTQKPDPKKPSSIDGLIAARYLIVFMGFFALFNGLIYNDMMSIPLGLFTSCYLDKKGVLTKNRSSADCTYPFGIDPAWGVAKNKLSIYNSFKMKTSVIFGVAQMILGVFLKGINSIYNASLVDFFFEFVPQLVFMCCTFGYMVFMIIVKWLTEYQNTAKAPSILTYMLDFGLQAGGTGKQKELYAGQAADQPILLILTLISVPLMLFPKPIIAYYQSKKHHQQQEQQQQLQHNQGAGYAQFRDEEAIENYLEQGLKLRKPEVPHQFSEEFVHQMIETIEFVLGSISHTASYLRLWALSLAHSQLADVFFEKTMKGVLESGSIIGIFCAFTVFALVTFAVLMCMDVMECFLHTLRLHWVEFQSKFYKADGYLFKPYSIRSVLAMAAVEKRY